MQIRDSFTVQAPIEAVWRFLLDIERLSQCLPGAEAVRAVDDKTYRGRLKVRVGPVAVAFNGTATLTEVDPPHRLVASIEGDDKTSASKVKASFTSTLTAVDGDDASTRLEYQVDVSLRGKLAQFGFSVVQAAARKMTNEFAKCLQDRLARGAAP